VRFDRPLDEWVADVREEYGLASFAIDDESTLQLLRLPALHRDPLGPHPRRAGAGARPRDPDARPRDPRLPRAHDLVSAESAETVKVTRWLDLRAKLDSR